MKKNIYGFIILILILFGYVEIVYAEETTLPETPTSNFSEIKVNPISEAIIIKNNINLRENNTTDSKSLGMLEIGTEIVIDDIKEKGNGCDDEWYHAKDKGYVCSTYASIITETNKNDYLYTLGEKVYRTIPSTTSSTYIIDTISPQTTLKVIKQAEANKDTCTSNYWYYVDYNSNKGWICGYNVSLIPDTTTDDESFVNDVLSKFPKSYHPYLIDLYVKHPTWVFESYKTGVDFQTAVSKESIVGVSLIQSKYQGFYSTDAASYDYITDKFYVKEGSSWYAANDSVVGFYLDPRNYLTENYIFAFEKLSYDKTLHTIDIVKSILGSSYLSSYAENYMIAANETNVSPVHLASRSYQELGSSTVATSGTTSFTCNGKTYNGGYYNFYNIGATTGSNPVLTGLCYASISNASYGRAWNTPQRAITGGASFIAKGYVNNGQDTLYLQKWDIKNGKVGSHQYMTNVSAAKSEASSTYSGYKRNDLIETSFVFKIPVYDNMPETLATLPFEGNPNNYIKTVTIDGIVLDTFDIDNTTQTINVNSSKSIIELGALPVNSYATITGTGTIDIDKTSTVKLIVKAQNKSEREYTFNFVKVEPSYIKPQDIIDDIGVKNDGVFISNLQGKNATQLISEIKAKNADVIVEIKDKNLNIKSDVKFKTGDIVTLVLNEEKISYTIVVNGDINGDGDITILDLLKIQQHILNSNPLEKEYLKAADVNSDSEITILDLLKTQKYLLGQSTI